MSKHFEGMGIKWAPLTTDPEKEVPQIALLTADKGGTRPAWQSRDAKTETAVLAWPQEAHLRSGVTVQGAVGGQLKPVAVFPFLEGLPNDMTVEEIFPWKNRVEAYVAACRNEGATPLLFYSPFYFRDREALTPGVRHTFSLAGLARGVRRALLDEMTITEGPQFEAFAAEWLSRHPEAGRLDVPQLRVSLSGARILMPGELRGDYQLRAPIDSVEETEFGGSKVYMLRIRLGLDTPEPLDFMLYAPEKVCKGFVPEAGVEIDALLWLEARIMD